MTSTIFARRLTGALTALICGLLGWWLHGPATPRTFPANASTSRLESRRSAGSNSLASTKKSAGPAAENVSDPANPLLITETMERVFNTDSDDMVDMMESFGGLTRLTDAEVKIAWEQLSRRVPSNNFGGGLSVLYLWSRMWQMGEKVALPTGWGAEDFEVALASEKARHAGEQSSEEILRRLESGEPVSETERRVIFGQTVRTDPLAAVKLWCRVTHPGDFQQDAPALFTALTKPESRDEIMGELRKWQADGDLAGTVAALARNWIDRDPEAVERWLQKPEQADIKDALMKEVINSRATANPVEAWTWIRSLPEEERRQALRISVAQFASIGPEEAAMGIHLIAGLQDPGDRLEAIGKFGEILAGNDINRWTQWRDTLSAPEQEVANETAFNSWARSDANAALEWLNHRPAGDEKDRMVGALARLYARQDPLITVELIRSIPDPTRRQQAVSGALSTVGPDDLDLVRTILGSLPGN